jgi:hypothetical protein
LNADAPEASKKIPATGMSEVSVSVTGLRTRAVKAVRVTANETGNLVNIRSTRKMDVCKIGELTYE